MVITTLSCVRQKKNLDSSSARLALFVLSLRNFNTRIRDRFPEPLILTNLCFLTMIATISYTILLAAIYVARKVVVTAKESEMP
ncbi:MAG: hypothetical protein RMJ33_05855 [Saprospiraceae bacterium]|nr:hypothetical protein [Saprospiraceae bacterium]MDW8229343.1 hypothetical protein [Saprospiraceae bacterium]